MKRRPVNLPRVRRTLAELEEHLKAHPEVRERTARYLAGDLEEREQTPCPQKRNAAADPRRRRRIGSQKVR